MNIYYSLVFLFCSTCAMDSNNQLSRSTITIYSAPDNLLSKKVDDLECSICFDDLIKQPQKPLVVAHCKTSHIFHDTCLKQWLNKEENCPLCRNYIDAKDLDEGAINLENDAEIINIESSSYVGSLVESAKKTLSCMVTILCLPVEHWKND